MKAIHCITSKYLDSSHIGEWAEHYLSIGFDKIFVFETGEPLFINVPKWHLDKNKTLVLRQGIRLSKGFDSDKWDSFCRSFGRRVCVQTMNHGKSGKAGFINLQNELIELQLPEYRKEFEWVTNIDTDELICGPLSLLESYPSNVGCVEIRQVIFGNIRENESFLRTRCDGPISSKIERECCKNIVRPRAVLGWDNVHYGVKLENNYQSIVSDLLYFEHHCGQKYKIAPIHD